MTKIDCFVNEFELNLYLDIELPPSRQTALDEHLGYCPDCSIRYSIARGLKNVMRDLGKDVAAPILLRERIINCLESTSASRLPGFWDIARSIFVGRPLLPIGMAVVLMAAFFAVVLLRPSSSGAMKLVNELVHEHDEYMESLESGNGIQSADPQEVRNWLAVNSDMNINLSKCDKFPSLVGACETDERGRAVTCLFFDRGEKRISLFVLRSQSGDVPEARLIKVKDKSIYCGNCTGSNYVFWSSDGLICILVSRLPEESLIKMVESLI